MADSIDRLFGDLQSRGFAKDKTLTDFRNYMLAPGEQGYRNRKQFFDDFKSQGMTDLETYEDFAGLIGLQVGKPERVETPSYQPSAEEMAGFQRTINSANRTAANPTQGYERKEQLMKKRQGLNVSQRVSLGESNNLTPTEQRLNPETGELEQGYMTSSGNEYDNKAVADMEQRQIDQFNRERQWEHEHPEESLMGQIDSKIASLEQRRNNAYAAAVERARAANTPQSGIGKAIHDIFTPNRDGIAVRDVAMDIARQDKDVMALDVALRDLQEAKTMMERNRQLSKSSDFLGGVGLPFTKDWFNNWKNFGYGVWDAIDDVTYNFAGTNDAEKAKTYLRIKDKMERGEELTDSETNVAIAGMSLAQAQQLADLPTGYTAGQTTLEMAPFMLQMASNPASGIGKALARKAVRQFGREGLGAITARVAARVAGNVVEAGVLTNTWQAPRTMSDIAQRYAGEFGYDDEGNIIMGHYEKDENGEDVFVEGGKSLEQSVWEGEASSIIENFTELGAGGSINGMLSKAAGTRLGQKMGLGYITDLVGKVGSTPFARSMKRFMERTHWDGMIEEPLEEEYGIILNSLLTGDNKISDLWDSKTQADIFAGTMWFGGMMAGLNTAVYPFAKRAMRRKLNNADMEGEMAFRDEWPTMKAAIEELDDKKIADFLYGIKDDDNFTKEQKAAMFGYAARLKQYQGANVADMLMRMENNLGENEAAIKGAYDAGTDAETPDEMKTFVDEATAAGETISKYGKEFTAMIVNGSADPAATLDYLMNNRGTYSDEEIAAAADYYQKNAKAQGVMDAAMDRVDVEVEHQNAEVRGNTHQQTGNVVMAKGEGDMDYYIIGGDIVTDPDTGMTSLAGTGGAVVVKDAVTGEVKVDSPQKYMMYSVQNADELIQQNETTLREQLMQQADDDITFGSPANEVYDLEDNVTLNDGNGGTIEGTVVTMPNAIDGVYVVQTSDGRALQLTGDDLNRRIVAHNGQEVQRATRQPTAAEPQPTTQQGQQPAQQPQQSGTDNAAGENARAEGSGQESTQPQSALSRIPVRTDANGQPVKNKKGRPILDWHKASTEDAAEALIETTGGDVVMARDTASDLVRNEQARLEKIRKQKPKGEDPQEIAESRMEIRRQEQEAQAIIKQWQDVGIHIRKRMETEAAEKRAAEEAAKSEEQKAREAEAARIRQEQQEQQARERRRKQVEEEVANWNKPYGPLSKARKEMEGDPEAMEILNRTEPETLEEWVSSLITPQSMMWDDETDPASGRTVIGLQSELGLQKKDIERIGGLVASRAKGGKPFGQVVHDIWEQLPEGMKNQYDDQDVRNALIGLFGEGNTMRMRHLTEEHRIEQARQTMEENRRRDREAEMDAWAEAYHLTPEERETFEDWLQLPPTEPEQEIINQIIADNEQNQASPAVDRLPDAGGTTGESEAGEGQVQGAVEASDKGDLEQTVGEAAEEGGNQPSPADDGVSGTDREVLREFLRQAGVDPIIVDRMSDYDVAELTARVDDWEEVNSDYGQVIEEQKDALKSKNKAERDAAKQAVDEAQAKANEAFESVEQYIEELQAKYMPEDGEDFEGAIPNPEIDLPRYRAIREALMRGYAEGNPALITAAAKDVQQYVDEGLNAEESDAVDIAEDYDGNDPVMLADQYIIRTFWDRYLDEDADQEYIRTGLKPNMRQIAPSEQLKTTDLRDNNKPDSAKIRESKVERWTLSEKRARNGERFYQDATGQIDLVHFSQELFDEINRKLNGANYTNAPLRLTESMVQHVFSQHSKELHLQTLDDAADFIIDVMLHFDHVRQGDENSLIFSIENGRNTTGKRAITILLGSDSGDYYGIKTSGFETLSRLKKRPMLWEGGAKEPSTDTATEPVPTRDAQQSGEQSGSASGQSGLSEGKGTKKSSNNQENQQKSSDLGLTSSPEQIAKEEGKVNTNPSEGQKEAGNYQKGHIKIDGYDITIENPKGSIRRGTDADGNAWETEMHNTYGYIRGTEGVDGDHIDVFLSDNPTGGSVFVVDQVNPSTGEFDEHKCMYGFGSETEAREAYLSNYSKGWKGLGTITEVSREEFKKWVESSHRKTKPFAEYKNIRTAELPQSTEQPQQEKKPKAERQHKRIVSDEKMEELRRQLIEKMKNLNEGIDVERMLIGAMYAVGKIERGVTKFADYAREMVEEIGDSIRPYLKSFYNAVRDMPEAREYRDQMDSAEYVENFDEYNFDKQQSPDPITKAQQVVEKQKAKKSVKKVEKEVKQKITQGDLFAGDLFGDVATPKQAEQTKKDENLPKTAWWGDPNRPKSLNPKDYKTYTTDEAREYFANFMAPADEKGKVFPDFTKWAHPNLAYITAAAWDGAVIPLEELQQLPEIQEAEARKQRNEEVNGTLSLTNEEIDTHANHLLDAEHGSQVYKNGKKVKDDYSGLVRQERKALIVIGRPAGGKSSVFADRLSYENGARIVDSDVVKPWLEGFDEGYGAGVVHDASAAVADRALEIAVENGDNMIIPRIGGPSVISKLVIPLRKKGYDVQLYFNEVSEQSSIMRAASRFAQEGRYLSLDYLTQIKGKDYKTFINFAEKNLGDFYDERDSKERPAGRTERPHDVLLEGRGGNRRTESSPGNGTGRSVSTMVQTGGELRLEPSGTQGNEQLADGERIFSYAEWKSNDVAFGEKPKEIWNSKSGKPMPGKKEEKKHETKQEVSREPESAGEGAGQASGAAERAGEGRGTEQDRPERAGFGRAVESGTAEIPQSTGRETQQAKPKPNLHKNKRNNRGERGVDYAPSSLKARFNANVEAIKMMRALMDEGIEAPTKDQMEVLRQYSGWGGMGTYFNDESTAENRLLHELLDDDEYNDAVMSINSAYYTPATVVDSLWDVAEALGFTGGNVLEGSAGIGNIIGQMPAKMSNRSDIEAVEIDKISGNILKLLYPDAKVHIQGFQDTMVRNGSVDLAITNVPFVTGLHVFDKVDKDLSRRFTNIHDFCIAKNIRKLKEGGIGIFISSSGTLDKSTDLRQWITDEGQADVVGAFRLNNKTFGGTTATSDIIVVRRRVGGKKSEHAIDISKASPMRVETYTDKYGNESQVTMTVNEYFHDHPEMMAGEMAFGFEKGETFRPESAGLYPVEGKDQAKMLKAFVKEMGKAKETATLPQSTERQAAPNQLTVEKEGRMLIDENGRLCVSRYGEAVPLSLNANKVKGYTKEQCFKDYQEVQKAVDDVLQQQLNDPDDAALKPKLDALNKAFDKFVKRYGYLHKNTAISFLKNDIDFPTFLELEKYSETKDMNGKVTVTSGKSPIFKQRVLGFKTEPQPKTVKDAVISSIFRTNGIDLEWITAKLNEVAAPPNGKNWTTDDVRKGILVSRLGFENPSTGQLEVRHVYLSGNVREKLATAEAYNTDGQYAANVEELRKVVPMDIPSHLIDFSLGSSWIPNELYLDYLKSEYGLPDNIRLTHIQGTWVLDVNERSAENETNKAKGVYSQKFRTNVLGSDLVVSALNNRPYKVAKQETVGYGSDKRTVTVVDQEATSACNVRIDEIKDGFKQYIRKRIQDDEELGRRLEKIYNEKFNSLVPMRIDDEMLPDKFEDANMNINLYDHQKRGVLRGITSPTMLAHEVGTGKSFTLISTAMEMRRLGTAKKPMLVVQNATVAQMTADAKLLYPNAKVLSLSEKDRDAEGRRAFYAKIRFNDWDLIIIPQSTLDMIPDSPQRELQFIQEQIDEKKHIIELARAANMDSREIRRLEKDLAKKEQEYGDTYLENDPVHKAYMEELGVPKKGKKKDAKREAASLDKAETKAREKLDRAVDDVQYFDDLGVDAILVDEAHGYKHLGFDTTLGRSVKGVDPSYSKKCAGLYNKTRAVFEKAGWKNVVFATGTPISNTAAEIWTFMKYLMPADLMRQNDIYYFDDFVHNFGSINQMLEFKTNGKFNEVTRFAAYVNRPELMRIWMQVADIVRTEEVGEVKSKVPEKENGKDQDVFLPQSPSLVSIMAAVRAELERFEQMDGSEKRENSYIPLTMYGIAKRAAIDPRLVDANAPDEPMSKTNAAVKEIVKDLDATKKYKGTVAVFCDNQNRKGADGSIDFNIFDDMKEKLVKQGVPEAQIAIIKSSMSITAKQKIFDKVNTGDVRVILGSTQTLGTGVNIQERLHLLIHMDAPDRPMDYTQRNGRIERQGNLHREWGLPIRILRFGVEDSLDVTAYQRLKTKSGCIDSIMKGKEALANNQTDRTIEEEEEGLFDNPVAVLSGSQFALKKNQAERELRKMQGKYNAWEADQIYVSSKLRSNASWIASREKDIEENEKALARMRQMFPNGKVKIITIDGRSVDLGSKDADKKLAELMKERISDPANALAKKLRENEIYNDQNLQHVIMLDGHAVNFNVVVSRSSEYDYNTGKVRTVVHKTTMYKSPDLHIEEGSPLSPSTKSVKEHLSDIMEQYVSGNAYREANEAAKSSIERTKAEIAQLKEREGQPFQFKKELEEAEKRVEEYTQLMKKEMQEKEAKYAEQAKEAAENGGFNLKKAEEAEDEDEDLRFSAEEDEMSDHVIRVLDALESEHPGFYDAFSVEPGLETGQAELWVSNREAAMLLYKNEHPDAEGDYYFKAFMWARSLFEDKLRDPSLQTPQDALPDFAVDAEQQRSRIIGTDNFKGFFGDWQNDPENASKVVDAEGKPLILYHGTKLEAANKRRPFWIFYPNSHFGTVGQADERIHYSNDQKYKKVYPVYLNIRNPKRVSDVPDDWEETHSEWWEKQIAKAKEEGHDGIVYLNRYEDKEHPADSWIAFYPEQVKSAQENVGTYDPTNPDIRHREAERFAEGQTFPIRTTEKQSSYNVLDRSRTYSTDLMPDEYGSEGQMLDALRNQYPEYYVSVEDGNVRMESWAHVFATAQVAQSTRQRKGTKNYVERKTRNAVNAVDEMARRMNLDVEVLTTTEGLTGKKARSKGWFNPKTGKITLVLPNNANQHDLINTLLHEGVAHYGLRHMFGSHFGTFLDNVYNNVSPEIKARIDASIKRNKWSRHEATEEYLARLAERTDFEHAESQGWWQKIKDFFIRMLGEVGFNTTLTDNDLRYILWRSYDNLLHPDRRRTLFDKAREVDMQRRLGINRYARERNRLQRTGRIDTSRIAAEAEPISEAEEFSDAELLHSIRTKEPPKKTGVGYKVFVLKDGQLYPPMVANPNGEGTPMGLWLDADAAPIAGTSKTGRPQVKAGGKGTQGGSGQLAYRQGWHLGTIPYALQFNRKDANGERTLFPNNFVWAEVEYADDVDYQEEAHQEGMNANGKYQHSLAGLKHVPTDGSYKYRTNPDPRTDEWVITGAMRVNRILSREEVNDLVRKAGREPQPMQDGDILTQEAVDELNAEIKATMEADEMGLLYRDDDDWEDDIAQQTYEKAVASDVMKWVESWQDSMTSLKTIQDAIAAETGNVATGAEDAYHFENRMHGRAKNMSEQYNWQYYRPMLKAFSSLLKAKNMTQEQGLDYLISKSGLERNVYYAMRDAIKAKITDEIKEEREKLEKRYARRTISEADYLTEKANLEERERTGVDDSTDQIRSTLAYQRAKEDYEQHLIGYTEYLRRIESLIRSHVARAHPKKDSNGSIVSDNYYDDYAKDYSGLTETFAKEMYDEAQKVKKQAQKAIDPQERRALWAEYDKQMRQAYLVARQLAEDAVFAAEDTAALPQSTEPTVTDRLWKAINAATKETLRQSYESGLIDRKSYNKVRAMFDYYIPLRGWEEDKAADIYTYMGRENVFSPAVKKTWGRRSQAENPLAYIGNIAVSTILSGHRNQMKQHFLNYVQNNPTSLVSISESWYENIAADGESPVWILRTADTAGKSADEIAQIVNDFNEEMLAKQRDGKAMPVRGRLRLDVNATKGQKAEHVVEVQRAGHTYQLYINGNPKAAQALNGTAAKAVSRISDTWLGKKITSLNRSMAAFFTSKNPAFVISNLSRDLNMAGASVAINEGTEYNARFIANVGKVLRPRMGKSSKWVPASKQPTGMMPSLMRKWRTNTLDESNETERLFKEFMNEGGETGFVNMLSVDSFKEKMKKEIAQMNGSAMFGKGVKETTVHKGLRLLGDTFEFYNRCAEDATRFIVYMTSRQMGKTLEESIADAKDVTLNFNRKGTGGMGNAELRDLFIFVNPAIQALANMVRMAKGHPVKFGAVTAAFVAGGVLMPIINQWLLNLMGDDDDKEAYWNLPPWVRKNNLVFWVPGTKNFVTIPLAQEFRVFYGVGEMISSAVMDHPVNKWGLEIFSSVADLVPINPTGNGGNLMVDFAPTGVQPLMQVGENVDFTGKPIWKENQGNEYAPMYTKAYISTPTWMVKLSEGLNDVTGGNEGKKGAVERNMPFWGDYVNNPAVWNHLLQGYFGGMYNTIAKTFDVGVTAAKGEMPKIYQTPVINRFLNRPVERDNAGVLGEEYYQLTKQRDALMFELRTWKQKSADGDEDAQAHVEEIMDSNEYKRAEVITHYEKILKDLKAGEKAATESADKADIKRSISLYKQQMMEELEALSEGKEPLDAAMEQYDKAKSFSERNKLRMRIEKLMLRQVGADSKKPKARTEDVEKALAYMRGEETESRNVTERYLELATAEDIRNDARIRAAKASIKQKTDEYKKMLADGRQAEARKFRERNQNYFAAHAVIQQQSRMISTNKKLLGKGSDSSIMRLIGNSRNVMLRAIDKLE